jgi:F-type H+-transporting ATPase subunit gamma
MYNTVCSMLARSSNINHPYLTAGESKRKAVVVITSNRGLAGGYNSNVVKLITESDFDKEDLDIYAIGGKGVEILSRKGYNVVADASEVIESPTYLDATAMCDKVLKSFTDGEIGEIYLAYTHFKNTVSQEPQLIKLLPVEVDPQEAQTGNILMNYEPGEEEALNEIIPKYVTSLFYGALVEAVASENGARMQAMDSATSNAEDMISDLSLKYNRARQGSITQELTEIIAGANAIS